MSESQTRRSFLRSWWMWLSVAVGYGIGVRHFLHYLLPLGEKVKYREMYAGPVDQLAPGQSKRVKTPTGDSFVMAMTDSGLKVLSDVCPHLGCRVHWVPDKKHFLCPCHMGIFDPEGKATAGPPYDAGQDLTSLETVVRGNSVFVLIKEA